MSMSPRLSARQLAELCDRLAIELGAGVDIRRVLQRAASTAPFRFHSQFSEVRDAVNAGQSLSTAFHRTGNAFPKMFHEMLRVGEETGMLAEVLRRLGQHYRHQTEMQRTFLGLIAWPVIQLVIAVFVIGFVIFVMGMIADRNRGQAIDILGLGLIGTSGMLIYAGFIATCTLLVGVVIVAMRRGMLWTRPLQRLAVHLPVVGTAIRRICLAQLTWAMHVTLNVEMDLRRLIPLVLRATGNDYYMRRSDQILAAIMAGQPLHVAFESTGVFPPAFIDAIQVGEESGELVETLGRLSHHYQEDAARAMKTLSVVAGVAVWLFVAALIIFMIFRLFGFYVGMLHEATQI
jgi:type II secretory pathway component PulF